LPALPTGIDDESIAARGSKNSMREHRSLAGQPGSAFGSASIDDSSALFGRHTLQKTVVSGPLDSAGLKCSLHCKKSLYVLNCLILFCHFTAEFIPAGVAKKYHRGKIPQIE